MNRHGAVPLAGSLLGALLLLTLGCGSPVPECAAPKTACGNECVDTSTNVYNCGTCGTTCSAGQVCSAGKCSLFCTGGLTACGASCRDIQNDATNCGGCDTHCYAGQVCVAGLCANTCGAGQIICDDKCVDPQTDRGYCGAESDCLGPHHGTVCEAGQLCVSGTCQTSCPAGQLACNGKCVNPQTDAQFCGAQADCVGPNAGQACGSGQVCQSGQCFTSCPAEQRVCDGKCVDPNTDRNHCGAVGDCQGMNAGSVCTSGEVCDLGLCVVQCPVGQIECGGKCVDPNTDLAYCGAAGDCQGMNAGAACQPGQVCAMGACAATCGANLTECNGACRDIQNDPDACGSCTNVCPGGANAARACIAGNCALACQPGFVNCDGSNANGCEVNAAVSTCAPARYCATDFGNSQILRFEPTSNGLTTPLNVIGGAQSNLAGPWRIRGTNSGMVYATGYNNNTVTSHPSTAANTPATTLLTGSVALSNERGIAVDEVHNELFVASNATVYVFPLFATGTTAPLRSFTLPLTPENITYDPAHDELIVSGSALHVYPRTATGTPTPLRTVNVSGECAVVDVQRDELVACTATALQVYPRTATGSPTPLRTISAFTFLGDVVVDETRDEYAAADRGYEEVRVVPRTANGIVVPLRRISWTSGGGQQKNVYGVTLCR